MLYMGWLPSISISYRCRTNAKASRIHLVEYLLTEKNKNTLENQFPSRYAENLEFKVLQDNEEICPRWLQQENVNWKKNYKWNARNLLILCFHIFIFNDYHSCRWSRVGDFSWYIKKKMLIFPNSFLKHIYKKNAF